MTVLSIRLTESESRQLRAVVTRDGRRVSDVVRHALAQYLGSQRHASVEWSMPPDSRLVLYVGGAPDNQTLNLTRMVTA